MLNRLFFFSCFSQTLIFPLNIPFRNIFFSASFPVVDRMLSNEALHWEDDTNN